MKTVKNLSPETQNWMEFLGEFDITIHGQTVKGYMDGGKVYLTPNDLRDLAKACIDVAGYMEAP